MRVTKEQICDAIWSESESENVKNLIGVNLAQIKKTSPTLVLKALLFAVRSDTAYAGMKLQWTLTFLERPLKSSN